MWLLVHGLIWICLWNEHLVVGTLGANKRSYFMVVVLFIYLFIHSFFIHNFEHYSCWVISLLTNIFYSLEKFEFACDRIHDQKLCPFDLHLWFCLFPQEWTGKHKSQGLSGGEMSNEFTPPDLQIVCIILSYEKCVLMCKQFVTFYGMKKRSEYFSLKLCNFIIFSLISNFTLNLSLDRYVQVCIVPWFWNIYSLCIYIYIYM